MPLAVDVSHWSGEITEQQMACLREQGVRRVIAGTQRRAIARQQLEAAVAAGLEVEAYVYLYLRANVARRVQTALETVEGLPVRRLWLDAEDTTSGLTRQQVVERLRQARAACGEFPAGIYTGGWWWRPHTADSRAFADPPLWHARYDDRSTLDGFRPFGGWERPAMKQYAHNVDRCGVPVDLNWYEQTGPRPGDPFSFDHVIRDWEGSVQQVLLDALLEGRVRGYHYVEWRGRVVPSVVIAPRTRVGG